MYITRKVDRKAQNVVEGRTLNTMIKLVKYELQLRQKENELVRAS